MGGMSNNNTAAIHGDFIGRGLHAALLRNEVVTDALCGGMDARYERRCRAGERLAVAYEGYCDAHGLASDVFTGDAWRSNFGGAS